MITINDLHILSFTYFSFLISPNLLKLWNPKLKEYIFSTSTLRPGHLQDLCKGIRPLLVPWRIFYKLTIKVPLFQNKQKKPPSWSLYEIESIELSRINISSINISLSSITLSL